MLPKHSQLFSSIQRQVTTEKWVARSEETCAKKDHLESIATNDEEQEEAKQTGLNATYNNNKHTSMPALYLLNYGVYTATNST